MPEPILRRRTTENLQEKAIRILAEGRLTITQVAPLRAAIMAECKGDSGEVYLLGYDSGDDRWGCQCEASAKFKRRCSHIAALQLVTVKPKEG
jgi:hypothetical protein